MWLDVDSVQDVALLRQVIHLQEAEIAHLHKRLGELVRRLSQAQGTSESGALQLELLKLSEKLSTLQHKMYGPSSEKRQKGTPQPAPNAPTPQTGHGPTPQPELPHTEQRHELQEAERTCPMCQHTLAEWPGQTEDSEEISVVERRFVVTTHKRQKYRCSCNAAILTAPGPLKLIEGGRYSLAFAVEVAVQKYSEHLPLDRQVRQMRRQGLVVTSQTLWDQIYALSQVLTPTYQALRPQVLSADVVHADETPWKLLETAPTKTWYVWGLSSEQGTYYHFAPSRAKGVVKGLLSDYHGAVICDGYPAYQAMAREVPTVTLCFCWAHVRRAFLEARPAYPQCEHALDCIGALYEIERQLPRYQGLDPPERAAALALRTRQRQQQSVPILRELGQWAEQQEALPQSSLRKAIVYMQSLWPGLVRFAADGRLPLGRVEHWRGGCRSRGVAVAGRFRVLRRCLIPIHGSVSSARSSNRACGFPAPGSPPVLHAFAFGRLKSVAGGL